ncbi:MAG: hypothetical protein PHP95_09330 [Desulfuromonadaceae bacterium]|nr:hypothetical protein [Desulfuromonadaceae bacterium]MDD2848645.1 hypothetical protein [Desulfuromonadaceae bacterium]MDD4130852.1 hypothetical protein [Desulfuromonadaceae bacterium]
MAKVTEKSLKERCTQLNLGPLRNTTFGIRAERLNAGYSVELIYRDGTPAQVLAEAVTAAEAAATVEGAAAGAAAVQVAGLDKPEFVTIETFVRQSGERCPKCSTKDINLGHFSAVKGVMLQACSCMRCELAWNSIYRLESYEPAIPVVAQAEAEA